MDQPISQIFIYFQTQNILSFYLDYYKTISYL